MKSVTLIQLNSPFLTYPKSFPNLGILYLSSYLKSHNVDVNILDLLDNPSQNYMVDSDIIGISSLSAQYLDALKILKSYKDKDSESKIIIGGSKPTFDYLECIENGFDSVIIGEGEKSLLSIASSDHTIQNLYKPTELIDVNSLFPDWDAIDLKSYSWHLDDRKCINIITSRGSCPFGLSGHCTFCPRTSPELKSKLRFRSVDHVLKEVTLLKYRYGYDSIAIYDDNVLINKDRDFKIFEGLKELDVKFRCMTRANLANKDDLRKLKSLGCSEICVGCESADQYILERVVKKGTSIKQNETFVKNCKEVGLRVKTYFIIGLPSESRESALKIKEFLLKLKPDNFDVSIFVPYRGSEIYDFKSEYDINWNQSLLENSINTGVPQFGKSFVWTSKLTSDEIVEIRNEILDSYERGVGGETYYWNH